MLRLVGQRRAAVFQPDDPGIRVGRALPVSVGQLLAFAIAIQADQPQSRTVNNRYGDGLQRLRQEPNARRTALTRTCRSGRRSSARPVR